MVIESKDYAYEVIQTLPREGAALHYVCRREGEPDLLWHLVQLNQEEMEKESIPIILDMMENPAFTDLKESFLVEGFIVLVFLQPVGEPVEVWLNAVDEKGKISSVEKFALGQQLLEQWILLSMPLYLQWEVLETPGIYVASSGEVTFYYKMGAIPVFGQIGFGEVRKRLFGFFGTVFSAETASGLYPEIREFLTRLDSEDFRDIMEVYQAYLLLFPVCSEERKEPEKEKVPLLERFKKLGVRLLTVVKIGVGIGAVAAACLLIPEMWKEHAEPVLEAAALWKAVYVDGETLEAETAEGAGEGEAEADPDPDPDHGRVKRYWDSGELLYDGDIKDGLYEGTGTLYFENGSIKYRGSFSYGELEGEGSLYTEEGILLYEGSFHHGKYDNTGKLYNGGTGNLIYEGGFAGGKYQGEGILFSPTTDYPVYQGSFRMGRYDGKGVEYDANGSLLYEGEFLLGMYHGSGTFYDSSTGLVLQEGEFRNGKLVMSKEEMENMMGEDDDTEDGELDGNQTENGNPTESGQSAEKQAEDEKQVGDGQSAGKQEEDGRQAESGHPAGPSEAPGLVSPETLPKEIGPGIRMQEVR